MQNYRKHQQKYLQYDPLSQQFAQKQRIVRHEQLIQNAKKYKPTIEQCQKLHKMKKRTELQIQLRYKNSNQNKEYCFPFGNQKDSQDDRQLQEDFKTGLYDLHSQNKIQQYFEPKYQIYQPNRRVKSLDEVVSGVKSQFNIKKIRKIEKIRTQLRQAEIQFPSKLKKSKTIVTIKNEQKKFVLPTVNTKVYHLMTEENTEMYEKNKRKVLNMKILSTESSPLKQIRAPKMKQNDFNMQIW